MYVGSLVGRMCLVCRMNLLVDGLSNVVDIKNVFPSRQIRSSRFSGILICRIAYRETDMYGQSVLRNINIISK